jgi:hypothetical protein
MLDSRRHQATAEHAKKRTHERVIRVRLTGGRVEKAQLLDAIAYFMTGPGSSSGVFCKCEWTILLREIGHSPRAKTDFRGTFRPC